MNNEQPAPWFDDYAEGADELQVDEYDITATPNDFNVMTLNSFVESGAARVGRNSRQAYSAEWLLAYHTLAADYASLQSALRELREQIIKILHKSARSCTSQPA